MVLEGRSPLVVRRIVLDGAVVWLEAEAVEGHVHRVTLLKRQGYGRATLALLRACVVAASEAHADLTRPNFP